MPFLKSLHVRSHYIADVRYNLFRIFVVVKSQLVEVVIVTDDDCFVVLFNMDNATRYSVLGTRYSVLGTRYSVHAIGLLSLMKSECDV